MVHRIRHVVFGALMLLQSLKGVLTYTKYGHKIIQFLSSDNFGIGVRLFRSRHPVALSLIRRCSAVCLAFDILTSASVSPMSLILPIVVAPPWHKGGRR